ncbi:MAG: hypothetical protein ABI364_04420, partial [Caldimonas sp.]
MMPATAVRSRPGSIAPRRTGAACCTPLTAGRREVPRHNRRMAIDLRSDSPVLVVGAGIMGAGIA